MSRLSRQIRRLLSRAPRPPAGGHLQPPPPAAHSDGLGDAWALFQGGHAAQALKLAQRSPPGGEVCGRHFLLGLCLDRLGRHQEALAAFGQELALHPGHAEARRGYETLACALAQPVPEPVPRQQRSWPTSLPPETLGRIQQALHHYTYRGVPMLKNPFDLALYPVLIWRLKPRTIIEIGSKSGGSALWLGDLLNNFRVEGYVYSLDIIPVTTVTHPRVSFLEGNGRELDRALSPDQLHRLPRPWLIIEDADHAYETSIATLQFFHPWLRPGEYIVIEDGIISDLTWDSGCNSGPHRALKEFLREHPQSYVIDSDYCDFFGHNVTWCTNGYLKRVRDVADGGEPGQWLTEARRLLNDGAWAEACQRLNRIKATRVPLRDTDYLRALGFMKQQQRHAAIAALREELRFFPDHAAAAQLLEKLEAETTAQPVSPIGEFQELLAVIRPYTMLSEARLLSLFARAKEVCAANLPGEFVECGVAAGGSAALLAAVAARHSRWPRRVFAFDTFKGMPAPAAEDRHAGQPADATGWGAGTCAAPEPSLREVCRKLGVEHLIEPVKGLFADTLPCCQDRLKCIALLHLDGDWYASTRDVLEHLYDRVVPGGRVQIDDYGHWEGCRQAVIEFQQRHGLSFPLQPIDETGVWFAKAAQAPAAPRLLNLGCGSRVHPDWVNVDLRPGAPGVRLHDLRQPLPFPDESFDAVYHSHMLEHLPHSVAPTFLKECFRVLNRGGIVRVVVPDLETIARLYLHSLEGALAGDRETAQRYDWMTLELLDQLVREQSGGEMLHYWKQQPLPAEEFVFQRMGQELREGLDELRRVPGDRPPPDDPTALATFQHSGELHRWMYDRYSLGRLLTNAGFVAIHVCAAQESGVPDFHRYCLDLNEDGSVRKPDSLFMEGTRP